MSEGATDPQESLQIGMVYTTDGKGGGEGEDLYVCAVRTVLGRTFALAAPVPSMTLMEYRPEEDALVPLSPDDVAVIAPAFFP
jgi:hypothetical protein